MRYASLQFPPLAVSFPVHKNALLLLSIWPIAQSERHVAMEMWMGMTDKVTFVSSARPAHVRRLDF